MDFSSLRAACKGRVSQRGDADFIELLHGNLWNRLIPERSPEVIVRVSDEQDIIASVRDASERGMKVVVRGGGHNWCQPTLRSGGMLIDLRDLKGVVSIDQENLRAVIRPIISNREIQAALNPLGLAFPTGHCPQVKASGYFLGGGMAWNPTIWGSGAESVEAIELVTAQGELLVASATENSDYFWAARGAGPGFFGIVTRYHLRLYPLPKSIWGSCIYYRLADASAVGDWLGAVAPEIAATVELSQFCIQAPEELRAVAAGDAGWICMVTGTAFEDTPEAARSALAQLERCPVQPLFVGETRSYHFNELFDISGSLWPEGLRARVEAAYSNHSPGEMMRAVLPLLPQAPSPLTVFLFTIFCGPDVPAPQRSDMALSMHAKVYGGPWTMWREEQEDLENREWHEKVTATLRPYNVGYYVGESDGIERPENVVGAFTPAKWQRLNDLRDLHDPQRLFFDYFDGFAEGAQKSSLG